MIELFLREKEGWIRAHAAKMREAERRPEAFMEPVGAEELARLKKEAKRYIPERAAHYAGIMGVSFGRISIRAQKTRYGSCSPKKDLSFNCILMKMPPDVIDYVVVHELCHILHMDHSRAFWDEVGRILPDYRTRRAWLKENGRFYIDAMKKGETI